ncbi:hypothetical protein PMAYCL1PPCAC_04472, partial [Pristionchus mayeri]
LTLLGNSLLDCQYRLLAVQIFEKEYRFTLGVEDLETGIQMDTSDDSEDSVDTSERQLETELICECEKIHRMNEDDDEEETSFSRATDDICWVNMRRLGVSTKCSSDDLETV